MTDTVAPTPAGAAATRPQPVRGLPDPGERVPSVAWPTVGLYVGSLALFALEAAGLLVWAWSPWLTVPLGAVVSFVMFTVLHEATHSAASSSSRRNDLLGHLSVHFVAAYATFPMIKFIHIEHHRNTNEPKDADPDAWTSEGPWWQLPFRWATIDLWYLVFYVRRLRERPTAEAVSTVVVFTGVVAGLVALAAAGFAAEVLYLVVLPQRIGLTVLAWWFDYLPHHGLTATQREDRFQATRVRVGGESWLTPLFVYQNYHLVHHLHPSVPFYRYLRAWRRNEETYLDRNAAISTWFGRSLTPEEYRTWRRLTDRVAGTPHGRPTFHPLRVAAVEPLTDDAVSVTFEVPADLAWAYAYREGQHVTLRAVVDGEEVRRSYSLTEAVADRTLRVAVKRVDGGVFSGYVHDRLAAGDVLDVMTPTGHFHTELDPAAQRHHVLVAAGSGITPIMSVLRTTLAEEPRSRVTLVYGNRSTSSTMFGADLDRLAADSEGRLEVHHVLSREEAPGAYRGRITPALLRELAPRSAHAWFLCGPDALVRDLRASLRETGVEDGRVLTEVFHVDAQPVTDEDDAADDAVDCDVTLLLDGEEQDLRVPAGETVLDAALRARVEVPYSCAGGACGTCRALVLDGEAHMEQNQALDDSEVTEGYVLTCQSRPTTARLRIDYDA